MWTGPHYFPYEIIPDEERGAVKIKESDRFLSPEVRDQETVHIVFEVLICIVQVLVAMILTYAKSMAQAQTKEKVSKKFIRIILILYDP